MTFVKKIVGLTLVFCLCVGLVGCNDKEEVASSGSNEGDVADGVWVKRDNDGNDRLISDAVYSGNVDVQYANLYDPEGVLGVNAGSLRSFKDICSYTEYVKKFKTLRLNPIFNDKNKKYIVISEFSKGSTHAAADVNAVTYEENKAVCYLHTDFGGETGDECGFILAIPVENDNVTDLCVDYTVTPEEFDNILEFGNRDGDPEMMSVDKPVIYEYGYNGKVKTTLTFIEDEPTIFYPQANAYNAKDGEGIKYVWSMMAKKDGTLCSCGRDYGYLYYEAKASRPLAMGEGFLVHKDELVSFLEEKLDTFGLTDKEAEDFITYWVPRMMKNEYNLVSFSNDYKDRVKLDVSPKANQVIRVYMVWKKAKGTEHTSELRYKRTKRRTTGKVVVEWGGSELD